MYKTQIKMLIAPMLALLGCSTTPERGQSTFVVQCETEYMSSDELAKIGGLPSSGLPTSKDIPSGTNVKEYEKVIQRFNGDHTSVLHEVFEPLLRGKRFKIRVIATSGIQDPYDAWTANLSDGSTAILFNLELWTKEDLEIDGPSVLRHEVAHILIHELVPEPREGEFAEMLHYIVFNEGIAHFLGYPGNRAELLTKKSEEWKRSEIELGKAFKLIADPTSSQALKEEILIKANTGRFWNKFGSISGLFRAAWIYEKRGVDGLREAVKKGQLPPT